MPFTHLPEGTAGRSRGLGPEVVAVSFSLKARPFRPCRANLLGLAVAFFLAAGLVFITEPIVPVIGATSRDWRPDSFWHQNWGRSGVHKGIDIFAPKGSPVVSATPGLVIFSGYLNLGGKVVCLLDPGLRIHYYAHLEAVQVRAGELVWRGERLGVVGNTGNAAGSPPHLHYSILSTLPKPWRWDLSPQGWKKIFYLDPSREMD